MLYSCILVKTLPEKRKSIVELIKNLENVIEILLLEYENYNILILNRTQDFKSINEIVYKIDHIEGVVSSRITLPWGEAWRPDAFAVLNDSRAMKKLGRYFSIVQDNKIAKVHIAKKIKANFDENNSLDELWGEHEKLINEFLLLEKEIDSNKKRFTYLKILEKPDKSFLDLKIEISKRILKNCILCSRRCNVNRATGNLGYCKCGTDVVVSSIYKHWGEEPDITPAGAIFTCGCTMKCLYCMNWKTSQWIKNGKIYSPKKLAKELEHLKRNGSRNAFLTGEPTPWLKQWLETLKYLNINVPIVWNSNAYYSEETAKLLAGVIDLYVLDFKYGSNKCAERISDAPNYWEASTQNYLSAVKYGELLIRILILPKHFECCTRPRLIWIAKYLGTNVRTYISLMYSPEWRANEIPELQNKLTKEDMEETINIIKETGLKNIII